MVDTEHNLEKGSEVYDSKLDEVLVVEEVQSNGTIKWEKEGYETETSVVGNLERGNYEKLRVNEIND